MKKILLIIVILLCWTTYSYATNYDTDSSPTSAEVQTLINNASAGDSITFQGDATWSESVTIDKAITINGNGTTLTASGSMSNGFFNITGFTASSLVRITGFTFQMNNWTPYTAIYVHGMTGGVSKGAIRIDHNTFHYGTYPISFYHGKGLIDNNYFYNAMVAITLNSGTRANADESWVSLAAGTADALFIEDNHFITNTNYTLGYTQEQIGTENGGKLVVRYNEFDGDNMASGLRYDPFMAHGNAAAGDKPGYWQRSTGCRRGQSVIEFYNNVAHGKRIDFLYQTRGSANLIYNNSITGTVQYNPRIYLWEEEYTMDDWSAALRTAWPAEDQVHNTFIWNNTYRGADFNAGTYGYVQSSPDASAGLLKDRDFFLHAPCGSSASTDGYGNTCTHGKATFTGANGASDSYPTDGNTYPTEGTMVFTSTGDNAYYGYTPYAYPHPLRGESGSGSYMIKIAKSGDGTGTVTEGENINCGENCAYDYYLYDGQEVEFTSTPATGSYVSGWSGCTQQTDPTKCKLTVSADATVTTSFTNGRKATLGAGGGTMTLGP